MAHSLFAVLLLSMVAQAQTPALRTPNFGSVTRIEEYKAVANTNYGDGRDALLPACYDTVNPTPVNTPNPLLNGHVVVDFVVGWDGMVYSPFVLEGSTNDARAVLQAMRGWRFRPGKCNGAPTNAEGRVKFRKTQ